MADDTKKKSCPLFRAAAIMRGAGVGTNTHCIGSMCALWETPPHPELTDYPTEPSTDGQCGLRR